MARGRFSTLIRLGKPVVAGLALAFLATAFVDRPAAVHFQPENPFKARQTAIVEPSAKLVVEKNVMKLGSPLSVTPDTAAVPQENPLAVLEREERTGADNATGAERPAQRREPTAAPGPEPEGVVPTVRGEVDNVAVPLPDPGQ